MIPAWLQHPGNRALGVMTSIACQAKGWTLHLRPDVGGCIEGLFLAGHPVLRSTAPGQLQTVRQSACYPLVPYSNRMANAQLHWAGASHRLTPNFPGEPHSIHGIGWQRAWHVVEHGDESCVLRVAHTADDAWPFAFDALQTFCLTGDGLEMTMRVTNRCQHPAPVGLGWHPYFTKRAGQKIGFSASARWEMGPDNIPTASVEHAGLHQCVDTLVVDHCFSGWSGVARLRDDVMCCDLASDAHHLVVFTTPEKDFVAMEPVSHANHAMNAGSIKESQIRGVRVLESGQSWHLTMTITARLNP